MLNDSETYLEKNMNAAANNMSAFTLHAFELGNHLDLQMQDQITQEKVLRNIEAHAEFIA